MKRIWLSKSNLDNSQGIGSPLEAINDSLDDFYQSRKKLKDDKGIEAAFRDVFPIVSDTLSLDYKSYRIEEPELSETNAKRYEKTRTAKLYAVLNKAAKDRDGVNSIEEVEARIGDILIPCDDRPVFIVGGNERTIVPQLRKAPGVFLEKEGNETTATIMPKKGSWLVIGKDNGAWTFAASRRGRKQPLHLLLIACGFSPFSLRVRLKPKHDTYKLRGGKALIINEYNKSTHIFDMKNSIDLPILCNRYLTKDAYDADGLLAGRIGRKATSEFIHQCWQRGVPTLSLADCSEQNGIASLFAGFCEAYDEIEQVDAIVKVFSALVGRKTEHETKQAAMGFYNAFFNPRTCVLSNEGRRQMRGVLDLDDFDEDEDSAITKDLIAECVTAVQEAHEGRKRPTDIYGLENRRLRLPGEMLRECLERGLREAAAQVRRNAEDKDKPGIGDLWNQRLVTLEMTRFSTGELCQLVDSYNPLTKATHAMRFSALGEGGILGGTRNGSAAESAAKLQVPEAARYVHDSHYGRLSPLGPEGENVGLVGPLAVNMAVDDHGFASYPARKVIDGRVTGKIDWLSPFDDENAKVAFGDVELNDGRLPDRTTARVKTKGVYGRAEVKAESVTHIDMSPSQCLSLESSLIPFIAHNDATRAAIASSQIRQAVPVLRPSSPIVGTGWEEKAAELSNANITARRSGKAVYADAELVAVAADDEVDIYNVPQSLADGRWRPTVASGDAVEKGKAVIESSASDGGELSVGRNVKVAFMTWHGYNFEDAIVVSERLAASEAFTSLHVKDLVCKVKETPFGAEETTDDLPNVAQSTLAGLNGKRHSGDRFAPSGRRHRCWQGDAEGSVNDTGNGA